MKTNVLVQAIILVSIFLLSFSSPNVKGQVLKNNDDIIESINQDSLSSYIQHLQDYGTRFMMHPNRRDIALWIKEKFISFGYENARIDSFQTTLVIDDYGITYDTLIWQYNAVARLEGSISDQVFVVGCHYDSFNDYHHPIDSAPGADDNGSGMAATLELARVYKANAYNPTVSIDFVAFSAEELMMFCMSGASFYVNYNYIEGDSIVGMITMDMIAATHPDNWTVTIYIHPSSDNLYAAFEQSAIDNTSLTISESDSELGIADCKAFVDASIPSLFIAEYYFSDFYHSDNDLLEHCNMDFCTDIVKMAGGGIMNYIENYTVIEEEISHKKGVNIFPNPTNGMVYINGKNITNIKVFNLLGKKVHEKVQASSIERMDISHLQRGIYIIKINNGTSQISKKIVLE